MSRSNYFKDYYQKTFKAFSKDKRHRTTDHNRKHIESVLSCVSCIDYATCKRFDRENNVGCEYKYVE